MQALHRVRRRLLRRPQARLAARIDAHVDARFEERLRAAQLDSTGEDVAEAGRLDVFVPDVGAVTLDDDAPFMAHSTCAAADIRHPRFRIICERLGMQPVFHRKQWEYAFIVHHLERLGMLAPGRRGIGFGVGTEPLPAAFAAAGCTITATDAPPAIGHAAGWRDNDEYSSAIESLVHPGICDEATFRRAVEHRFVDMNAIPDDATGYDFCWSACCFEHLGSLRHGVDFVVDSVERVLRPGGVAIHTTEYNLLSDDETFESPGLSVYRRRDLVELSDRLRARGHIVDDITVAPDTFYLDQYVDIPPYTHRPHMKLELEGCVTTSVGLVITRAD